MIAPDESVLRSDEVSWKSVVEPVFDTENRVEVADAVEEPIAKSVVLVEPLTACTESVANGDELAIPIAPVVGRRNWVEVAGSVPKRIPPMLRPPEASVEVAKILLPIWIFPRPVVREPVSTVRSFDPRRVFAYPVVTPPPAR